MKLEEGNKLIAEFMEFSHSHEYYDWDGKHEVEYHSSWDWLMPVVEKIELLPCPFPLRPEYNYKCYSTIGNGFVQIEFVQKHDTASFHPSVDIKSFFKFYSNSELHKANTKIEAVWEVIIQFIQWYDLTITPNTKEELK